MPFSFDDKSKVIGEDISRLLYGATSKVGSKVCMRQREAATSFRLLATPIAVISFAGTLLASCLLVSSVLRHNLSIQTCLLALRSRAMLLWPSKGYIFCACSGKWSLVLGVVNLPQLWVVDTGICWPFSLQGTIFNMTPGPVIVSWRTESRCCSDHASVPPSSLRASPSVPWRVFHAERSFRVFITTSSLCWLATWSPFVILIEVKRLMLSRKSVGGGWRRRDSLHSGQNDARSVSFALRWAF